VISLPRFARTDNVFARSEAAARVFFAASDKDSKAS
jgi:hypothetical protein